MHWAAPVHVLGHRAAPWWPCPAQDYPGRDFTCFSANDFGLFLSDEDPKKGIWLEAGKALDYYMLRNGVSIHPTSFQLHPLLSGWMCLQHGGGVGACPAALHCALQHVLSPPQLHWAGGSCWTDGGMWVPCTGAAARSCALLCPQDTMEYKKKQRPLKIRMLDGTVKTVMVDDSKTVTDMLMTICARIGEERTATGGKKGGGDRMAESDRLLGEQQQLCGRWSGSRGV